MAGLVRAPGAGGLEQSARCHPGQVRFRGQVELAVQRSYGSIGKVAVRPTNLRIPATLKDEGVFLTLDQSANISVEFDGAKHHNLHVFAGKIDRSTTVQAPDVVRFGLRKPR